MRTPLSSLLETFENGVAALGLWLMLILVCVEILMRNVGQGSFMWAEEVARYLMIWSVYFAAASLISSGGHLRVELLLDRAGPKLRKTLNVFAESWVLAFAVALTISGYQFVESSFIIGFTSADSNFPLKLAWMYLVIPLTFFLTVIHASLRLIKLLTQH